MILVDQPDESLARKNKKLKKWAKNYKAKYSNE